MDMSFRGRLCLLGADRQRFLNGQVTNNVKDLQNRPGLLCRAGFRQRQIAKRPQYLLPGKRNVAGSRTGLRAGCSARLEKYIIAEDVQIIDASRALRLVERARAKGGGIVGQLSRNNAMDITKIEDPSMGEIVSGQSSAIKAARASIFSCRSRPMQEMARRLLSRGGRLCGWQALETARMEAGIPRFGADMDETNLAPEALDERAISYSKGCYIGQEVIARIRTYGQVGKGPAQF